MTTNDSSLTAPLDPQDPALRSAALASLGLSDELTAPALRSALLKRLEDEQFVPDEPVVPALLCLAGAPIPSPQSAEIAEAAARSKLRDLRERFASLSPTERRDRWNDLQRFVPVMPLLARPLKAMEPGLDWSLPGSTATASMESGIIEQALIQLTSSPKERIAARIKFFSEAPKKSRTWTEGIDEALDQNWKLFQIVPDFERELRAIRNEASPTPFPDRLHQGWTAATNPQKNSGFNLGKLTGWPIAFLIFIALRILGGSLGSTSTSRPRIDSNPTITMPSPVKVNTQPAGPKPPIADLLLGRRIGLWPSEETQSNRFDLGLFLQQKESIYRKPGAQLSRTQAEQELKILETLLEKYEVLPQDPAGRRAKLSVSSLKVVVNQLKDFVASERQQAFVQLPSESSEEIIPGEALERLLGLKAPVINGVDLAAPLIPNSELLNPERLGERLRERAEAYRKNPVLALTPVQLKREIQQLERFLSAYSELSRQRAAFSEETAKAAIFLQRIAVQLQASLDRLQNKAPPTSLNPESER